MAGLDTLLPGAGSLGAIAAILIVLIRYLGHDRKQITEADQRYDDEVKAHRLTQQELDSERAARRKLEDTLGITNRKLTALTETVEQQTAHIQRLETQVAQLTGGTP